MFRNETGNEYPGGRTCLDTPRRFLSYEKRAEVFTTPNDDEIYCVCLHSEVMAEEKCKDLVKETLSVIQKKYGVTFTKTKKRGKFGDSTETIYVFELKNAKIRIAHLDMGSIGGGMMSSIRLMAEDSRLRAKAEATIKAERLNDKKNAADVL